MPNGVLNQADPRTLLLVAIAGAQYLVILFLGHQAKWDSSLSIMQLLFATVDGSVASENIVNQNVAENVVLDIMDTQ